MMSLPSVRYVDFVDICEAKRKYGSMLSVLPLYIRNELASSETPPDICDLAGRDSIAAILKAFEEGSVSTVLPIANFKDVQYGSWRHYEDSVRFLQDVVPRRYGGRVYDFFILGDREFWLILSAKYAQELVNKFGFYSPCPGCHLHFHSMRAVVAHCLGSSKVISGERESHDGNIKINQYAAALDSYAEVMRTLGIQHLQPVRFAKDGSEIERIIGRSWKGGEEQLKCVLSGNYRVAGGKRVLVTEEQVRIFFREFAAPVAKEFIRLRLEGEPNVMNRIDMLVLEIFRMGS